MFNTRTEQTSTTTGTGTLSLIAPITGRVSFVTSIGSGNPCYYICQSADESAWEEGIGTITSGAPDTLSRTTVIRSSNSNNLVNFAAGTKTVYIGVLADTLRFGSSGQLPTVGGTANAITLSYAPAITHLRAGMRFAFVPTADNTTAVTVSHNGLGAVSITRIDGTALAAGDIKNGSLALMDYDGTKCRLENPQTLILQSAGTNLPGALNEAAPVVIATASTMNIGAAASNNISATGSTAITGFDTVAAGIKRSIIFVSTPVITYNATSLILPGAANITAAAGDVAEFESLGSGNWQCIKYMRANGTAIVSSGAGGFFRNLYVRPGATPNTQIRVTADVLVLSDSSGVTRTVRNLNATADCTVNGAVNRLDAGSLANSTWYFVWVISNGTTDGVLVSTSSTAPTLPSGYTYSACYGATYTDGSAHFLPFNQYGRRSQYVTARSMASGTSGTYDSSRTAVSISTYVPTIANVIYGIGVMATSGANTAGMAVAMNSTDTAMFKHSPNTTLHNGNFSGVLESSNIYWSSGGASNAIYCHGYEINL